MHASPRCSGVRGTLLRVYTTTSLGCSTRQCSRLSFTLRPLKQWPPPTPSKGSVHAHEGREERLFHFPQQVKCKTGTCRGANESHHRIYIHAHMIFRWGGGLFTCDWNRLTMRHQTGLLEPSPHVVEQSPVGTEQCRHRMAFLSGFLGVLL